MRRRFDKSQYKEKKWETKLPIGEVVTNVNQCPRVGTTEAAS